LEQLKAIMASSIITVNQTDTKVDWIIIPIDSVAINTALKEWLSNLNISVLISPTKYEQYLTKE
jgi:hypothetical protein